MRRDKQQAHQTYTVREAAHLLRIGTNQAYEAVRVGTIPSLRIGRRLLIPRAALERLLSGEQVKATSKAA